MDRTTGITRRDLELRRGGVGVLPLDDYPDADCDTDGEKEDGRRRITGKLKCESSNIKRVQV